MAAICRGSAPLILRVRLLSIPQARQAPATSRPPHETPPIRPPFQVRTAAPVRIAKAPSSRRRSTFSRNTSQAMAMVARPSRLSSSAAVEAGVTARPSISRTGPTTPPATTAPASHGRSPVRKGAWVALPRHRRARTRPPSPTPEPR